MKIFLNKKKLLNSIHREKNLGFVPTMGAIHTGHISLMRRSLDECDKTVVSIFVNKPQFNKKIDFKKYPRNIKKDILILKKIGVDILFIPTNKDIYPAGVNKNINISTFANILCGKNRPGHFKAVVDVVDRLIKIVKPKKIYLGEKDMQQLKIIQDYVKKNKIKVKVINCKTVRESSGIPYSSRNFLLSKKQKNVAKKIYNFLFKNKHSLIKNIKNINKFKIKVIKIGADKIDYINILDINKINKPYKKKRNLKIFIAYYLGKTRLIDNF